MMIRLLLILCCLWLPACRGDGHWENREIVHGYRGKARVNPYLAAVRLLESGGVEAKTGRLWPVKEKTEKIQTIFMPASFLSTKGIGKKVLSWVEDGGTLVVFLEGGEANLDDFSPRIGFFGSKVEREEDEFPGLTLMSEEVGFEIAVMERPEIGGDEGGHLERKWHEMTVDGISDQADFSYLVEFEGNYSSETSRGIQWEGETGPSRMTTQDYGYGTVMLLAHARPFRNAYIGRADHAGFLEEVVTWDHQGEVLFLSGVGDSFFGLLWNSAWQAVVGGLVLLLAWLWMRVPRFGPILDDGEIKRHEYGSHLLATARFLWRQNQISHLLRPFHPEIEAHRHGEDDATFHQRLADEHKLSVDEVREAMTTLTSKDSGALVRVTRTLQILTQKTSS